MNYIKAIFQLLKKLDVILDALIELYNSCDTGLDDKETAQKIQALKKMKG